jgi:type II secretory ATPase GspE/PulE/Tfp pilus assembly ATPase PilB-like protein
MHVERVGDVATLRFRIDGALERMRNGADGQVVGDLAKRVLASVYDKLVDDGSNTSSSFNEKAYFSSTVTYELPNKRLQLRCQVNPSADGFDFIARFRLVRENASVMSYREMGYTSSQVAQIEEALKGRRGLIIIAGIPNSGKTTLVEAMLTHFPNKEKYKFVTLDDPVEFKVPGVTHATIKSIPGNPEESAKFYTQAMESWLRGNPDVISLGEIRNGASGMSAITTARVGCLGIATIHANSQMGIYERLTDPEIGLAIRAITSDEIVALGAYQSLVPLVCQECALSTEQMPLPMQSKVKAIADKFKVDTSKLRFSHGHIGGEPCPVCNGRGTFGMKVVAEMYSPTEEFLKSLRAGDDFGARDIWLAESDGRFDSDDMTGKPVFLHAFKDALDGRIDLRSCERFGSFEKYKVTNTEPKNLKVRSA